MSAHLPRFVVVGADGSPASEAALRFALDEARLRGASLRVVCAWEASAAAYIGETFAPTPDVFLAAEEHAEDVLRAALDQLRRGGDTGVQLEALAIEGAPASVLAEQARGAELLVVGSRGHGAAASLLLGSTSQTLAHHTTCPLVIVPHGR